MSASKEVNIVSPPRILFREKDVKTGKRSIRSTKKSIVLPGEFAQSLESFEESPESRTNRRNEYDLCPKQAENQFQRLFEEKLL